MQQGEGHAVRYFTPELFVRLQECPNAEAFPAVNAAWEQSAQQYWEQLQQLTPQFPPELRRFVRWGSMHDARVLEIGTAPRRTTLVLLEDRAPRLVFLTYSLVDAPVIDRAALPREHHSVPTLWLYDEVERDPEMLYNVRRRVQHRTSALPALEASEDGRRPIFLHSILLSNGWEIRLRFHRLTASRTNCLLHGADPTGRAEELLTPSA
jgi:hypothetical protein